MKDRWHAFTKWLDHNRWTFVCLALAAAALIGVMAIGGCQAQTASLQNPDRRVTRPELAAEAAGMSGDLAARRVQLEAALAEHNEQVAAFNERVDLAEADLQRQEELRAQILRYAGVIAAEAASGNINPAGYIPIGVGLLGAALGVGTKIDNRRKDHEIMRRDNELLHAQASPHQATGTAGA
jgi:hypothetical protein